MSKVLIAAALVAGVAAPASAQNTNYGTVPQGAHYSLNIIGVENPKKSKMRDSNRHTIFVALTGETRIYLVPGPDFVVCDGNGFDAAVDCSGDSKPTNGAVFQLPCNDNLPDDNDLLIACDEPEANRAFYEVWARALGQPGGSATVRTCAWDPDLASIVCSAESVLIVRPASPNGNKPAWQNVTNELTSMVVDIDGDGSLDRVALFASNLEDWFWKYTNDGLRLAQLRFYVMAD
jgi:hypothetical protein